MLVELPASGAPVPVHGPLSRPWPGQTLVYVPSRDGHAGGIALVSAVKVDPGTDSLFVSVTCAPASWWSWDWLVNKQDSFRSWYGDRRAVPDSDWQRQLSLHWEIVLLKERLLLSGAL